MTDVKHGSESQFDPTAIESIVMAAAAERSGPEPPLPASVQQEDITLSVSEDSVSASPPAQQFSLSSMKKGLKKQRPREGSRTKRSAASAPRSSTGPETRRGLPRPPSPCLEPTDRGLQHELCGPVDGTPEARLEALERQQKVDHLLFNAVKGHFDSLHHFAAHIYEQG